MKNYEIVSHKADLAIKGYGKTIPELFSHIIKGLFKQSFLEKQNQKTKTYNISIKGEDTESLLVNLLNELLYLSETENVVFGDLEFNEFSEHNLASLAHASPLLAKKIDVKAATLHNLKIEKIGGIFTATVIFDI